MPSVESKYKIREQRDGFIIEGRDRVPVTVILCDTGFRVKIHRFRQQSLFPVTEVCETDCNTPATNLVQYRRLLDFVAQGVMQEWKPRGDRYVPHSVRTWALSQTRRAIGKRIHQQWVRLTSKIAPNVFGVQKAVFAATFRNTPLLHQRALYQNSLLVQDILNYRAAAALVPVAAQICSGQPAQSCCINLSPDFDNQRRALGEETEMQHSADETVAALSNWQGLCSPTGNRYRSLSRTLMNFPGGIPCDLLFFFHVLRLNRPVTHRLELLALLLTAAEQFEDGFSSSPIVRILHKSSHREIRNGMNCVSHKLESPLSHRRTWDVGRFIAFILATPKPYHGRLSGLVRRAIRYHRSHDIFEPPSISEPVQPLDRSVRTQIPPTGLPCVNGVRFLKTVGEIIDEGKVMQHCVQAYVNRAVRGSSYLFHIEHLGEHATAELDEHGHLRQAFGPMNYKNTASDFAVRLFDSIVRGQRNPLT